MEQTLIKEMGEVGSGPDAGRRKEMVSACRETLLFCIWCGRKELVTDKLCFHAGHYQISRCIINFIFF